MIFRARSSAYVASRLGLDDVSGLVVSRVSTGSPADKADLQVGDVIHAVNHRKVNTARDAQRVLFGAGVGDRVELNMIRGGEPMQIFLTFEENPEVSR